MALEDIGVKATIEGLAGFKRGVGDMDKGIQGLGRRIQGASRTFKIAGAALTAFAVAAAFVGFKLTQAASDAEEMRSKFDVVFGKLADDVAAWADETARAVNRSRFDFIRWLATLQDTFVPLGFARDRAAEFSKQLVTLAVDVASFNNVVEADVIRDFQSALVGNTETVRKYGIVITEANTKQEILNQGWAQSESTITAAMKVQARLNIIMAGTTDAQGDAARTSETFANEMRGLEAAVLELQVSLGQRLLPVMTEFVGLLTSSVSWVNKLPGPLADAAVGVAGFGAVFAGLAAPIFLFLGFLPQVILGFTAMRTGIVATARVITLQLIPAIARLIARLVVQVAAQVAVLATAGPAGWAILAGGAVAAAVGLAAITKAVGGFQTGGTIGASGMALVGERGPELVRLPAAAQVIPAGQTTHYNVTAHYTNPQQPQGIRMDLEAIAMMARR